jgi:hypothetical protein
MFQWYPVAFILRGPALNVRVIFFAILIILPPRGKIPPYYSGRGTELQRSYATGDCRTLQSRNPTCVTIKSNLLSPEQQQSARA